MKSSKLKPHLNKQSHAQAQLIIDTVRTSFPDTSSVEILDLACGQGEIHPLLQTAIGPISGVDCSAEAIGIASAEHSDGIYMHYDGHSLPFPDASFELCFSIGLNQHRSPNWPNFLLDIKRVLKPGGLLILVEHNPLHLFTQIKMRIDENQARLMRATTLHKHVVKAGFKSAKQLYLYPHLMHWRGLRRCAQWLATLPFPSQYYLIGRKPKQN